MSAAVRNGQGLTARNQACRGADLSILVTVRATEWQLPSARSGQVCFRRRSRWATLVADQPDGRPEAVCWSAVTAAHDSGLKSRLHNTLRCVESAAHTLARWALYWRQVRTRNLRRSTAGLTRLGSALTGTNGLSRPAVLVHHRTACSGGPRGVIVACGARQQRTVGIRTTQRPRPSRVRCERLVARGSGPGHGRTSSGRIDPHWHRELSQALNSPSSLIARLSR